MKVSHIKYKIHTKAGKCFEGISNVQPSDVRLSGAELKPYDGDKLKGTWVSPTEIEAIEFEAVLAPEEEKEPEAEAQPE